MSYWLFLRGDKSETPMELEPAVSSASDPSERATPGSGQVQESIPESDSVPDVPVSQGSLKKVTHTKSQGTLPSAASWLGWGARTSVTEEENDNENAIEEEGEADERGGAKNEGDDFIAGKDESDDTEEIEDHVSTSKRRGWSFWSNNNITGSNPKGSNNKVDHNGAKVDDSSSAVVDGDYNTKKSKSESFSNAIIESPSFTNLRELKETTANIKGSSKKDGSKSPTVHPSPPSSNTNGNASNSSNDNNTNESVDDAVLYKPHDQPNQFDKINTHKNENIKENVIVPNWNSCLPSLSYSNGSSSSFAGGLFRSSMTNSTQNNAKIEVKNWRTLISQLSSRLGLSSTAITGSGGGIDEPYHSFEINKSSLEKQANLLYERTYKLYGKSLAKLPPHKRACLPNYSKVYDNRVGKGEDETYVFDQQTQLEEDAADPNSISITSDATGNLLINADSHDRIRNKYLLNQAQIRSQKTGPLNKIRKILIIGVHGFFPTKMIRPIIGAPKGTSSKFANEAEKAVIRYCEENNLIDKENENQISIQKIALEKEGKILDRVEFFTEILLKWQEELNSADFIFFSSHSQGCVVSIILLARLINEGILKNAISKRIGILGMAGINNGPIFGRDKSLFMKAYSAIEHESLMELFELNRFESIQSMTYKDLIQIIVNSNVKICLVGSINDQLVPLYSALALHVFHPNIYRACYVDHASQTPLFIQKVVSLCCQMQNLGYFDNNVIKELSTTLAGPLTGGGHSKIYNDGKVYDLGIKFCLDTDDIVIPSITADNNTDITRIPINNQVYYKEYNISKLGTNPYMLPWCLRGFLFNVEKNWPDNTKALSVSNGHSMGWTGYDEVQLLFTLFETWKPDSKAYKELKFKLNGFRASKL
ncbi:uncharacterized protein KQ657_004240 [Scheffersomyces spartinae]|uniref:YMC020W-like alpha/beta hydrolase domain-containing protein n=1 Tax=Scheffersomyces spartinae TaxID=45513 RepID=A0A9P7VAV2_9ASCO|nr:uncharacterized protein KQ657_004240 [Scheffersomyces spartinae]KAG7194569.1 hypothetical protein KQ657_004240 [Scheffersomyces spartinae]